VNPNYQGNAYDEYYGDNPVSQLDCHNPDTQWELLGVYRQEFYQYIEQISKHIWAIDDYEYVVALAGLSYMTNVDCYQVGYDGSGNAVYAGVAPQPYGEFQMRLYSDSYCLNINTSLGKTLDDFVSGTSVNLGSKDQTDDGKSWATQWWSDTQEYTLTQLNDVYDEFKYCTSCVDYPTYQDGYYIGDNGKEDGNLINQCWKFYSHNSYTCEADCIAMAHAQGTILSVKYGDTTFGKTIAGFYQGTVTSSNEYGSSSSSYAKNAESPLQKLMANAALTASFLLFVATFLAFAVARRSRYRESKNGKSRRLLDDDEAGSRKSRKSRVESDGLMRASGATRSKSSTRRSSSRTKEARSGGRSSSSTGRKKRTKSYEPPQGSPARAKSAPRGIGDDYF
jgi:hypothetical protein